MGTRLCFYHLDTTDVEADIIPLYNIPRHRTRVNDTAPIERWDCDVLDAEGEARFRAVVDSIMVACENIVNASTAHWGIYDRFIGLLYNFTNVSQPCRSSDSCHPRTNIHDTLSHFNANLLQITLLPGDTNTYFYLRPLSQIARPQPQV